MTKIDKIIKDLIANEALKSKALSQEEKPAKAVDLALHSLTTPKNEENILTKEDFQQIKNHFQMIALCNKQYKNLAAFILHIENLTLDSQYYSSEASVWSNARKQITDAPAFNEAECTASTRGIAYAVMRLQKKGIKVDINRGIATLSNDSQNEIIKRIQFRCKQAGHNLFLLVMHILEQDYFKPHHQRYYFRKELNIERNIPQPPLGYLFNLSLAHTEKQKKTRTTRDHLVEIFELSEDLVTLLGLQRLEYLEGSLNKPSELLPYLKKNVTHDQMFMIEQMSKPDALTLMNGLFGDEPELEIYIDIYEALSRHKNRSSLVFKKHDLEQELLNKYHKDKVSKAIDELSFSSQEINKGFTHPFDIEKINSFQKPFIKRKDDYLFPHPNFSHAGFIFTLYKKLNETFENKGHKGKVLHSLQGKKSEQLIERIFNQYNIKYHANKKYTVPRGFFNEINSSAEEGECDFIIEGEEHILFIELKSKTLTANARKGDSDAALLDLTRSLLASLEQAGRHEYVLRKLGEIVFTDNTKIELKNRDIERISLTTFDFHSLSDANLIQDILAFLPTQGFNSQNSENSKAESDIRSALEAIKKQQQCELFRDQYTTPRGRLINFNNRFFSAGQILAILKYSKNTNQFVENLNKTRQLGNNTRDWYYIFNHFVVDYSNLSTKSAV